MDKKQYTTGEIIDSIVADINDLLKEQICGQYVQCCFYVTQITTKLMTLKKDIEKDMNCKNEKIEMLKQHIKDLNGEVDDNDPVYVFENNEKDGANNGSN